MDRSDGQVEPDRTSEPAENGSAAESASTASAASAKTPRGPVIVPTLIDLDGIKTLPRAFELCEVDELITLIASMLDRLIAHNDLIPLTPNALTRFHSRAPPGISVREYLVRITRYTNVEPCCLLILLHYVDKISEKLPTFTISSLTVHRFIIAAVACGSKALSDSFCTNARYGKVGGVSLVEMNLLEIEFLTAIDWRLTTTGTLLSHYYTSLVKSHPGYVLAVADAGPSTSVGVSSQVHSAAEVSATTANGDPSSPAVPASINAAVDSPVSAAAPAPSKPSLLRSSSRKGSEATKSTRISPDVEMAS